MSCLSLEVLTYPHAKPHMFEEDLVVPVTSRSSVIHQIAPRLAVSRPLRLCTLPSPVRPLHHCSRALNQNKLQRERIYLKDDRCLSPIYGGNKARKLSWLLADALYQGAKAIMTTGGTGSHHALATARFADVLGLTCHVLQVPQPHTHYATEVAQALQNTQAIVKEVTAPRQGERITHSFRRQLASWRAEHPNVYFIPSGGSSILSTLAHVEAALELVSQVESGLLPLPKKVYIATGSCSTLAGLTLGFHIASMPVEVVGIAVTSKYLANPVLTRRLIEGCMSLLNEGGACLTAPEEPWRFTLLRGYNGKGYGVPTKEGSEAIKLGQADQLDLDPIYTAKAMSGLLDLEQDQTHHSLFWHTLSSLVT